MAHCDLYDLPTENCDHCREQALTRRTSVVTLLEVSPKKIAHFPGCAHPGEDYVESRWGFVEGERLWQRLQNGEAIPATSGPNLRVVAEKRCPVCAGHGPWE